VRAFTAAHSWCERPRERWHTGWDLPHLDVHPKVTGPLDAKVISAQEAAYKATQSASLADPGVTLTCLMASADGVVLPHTQFIADVRDATIRSTRWEVHRAIRAARRQAMTRGGTLAAVVLTVLARRASFKRVADVIVVTPGTIQRRAFPDTRRAGRWGWLPLAHPHGAVDGLLAMGHP
jgi:hypothetical protein